MRNKSIVFGVFVLAVFLVIPNIHASQLKVTTVSAFKMKADSLGAYNQATMVNITAEIAPATAGIGSGIGLKVSSPKVITLAEASVVASTFDYSKKQFETFTNEKNVLHSLTTSDIKQFVNLRSQVAGSGSSRQRLSITSFCTMASAANDSALAVGETTVKTDKASHTDLKAEVEYQTNVSEQYLETTVPDAKYASIFQNFPENESWDSFVADVNDEERISAHFNYYENLEESLLLVLKQNIAANYSTTADIITPDRVTIFDYAVNVSDPNYFKSYLVWTKDLDNHIRDGLNDMLGEDEETTTIFKLWGVSLFSWKVTKASASPTSTNRLIVGDDRGSPIRISKVSLFSKMDSFVKGIDSGLKSIGNEIKAGCPTLTGILRSGASNIASIPAAIATGQASAFAKGMGFKSPKEMVTNTVSGVTKFASNPISWITGTLSKLISYLPLILISLVVLGVLGLIGYLLLQRFILGRSPDNQYQDYKGYKPF